MTPVNLKDLSRPELVEFFEQIGQPRYRADQVFRWIFGRGVRSFEPMTNLGKALRAKLAAEARIDGLSVAEVERAPDDTKKIAFDAIDGARVEAVLIPDEVSGRLTLCLSTQVGCAMACAFCRTAELGFQRNLTSGEIVDQVLLAREVAAEHRISNLVFMGMGEPLNNLKQVIKGIEILLDDSGPNFSARRITVSTSGIAPRMHALGTAVPVKLAVSLNAATDTLRNEIMPVNRKFPLKVLLDACRRYPLARRDVITFEYVLLGGVNDAPDDADRLLKLMRGIPSKINLIAFNEYPGCGYKRPSDEAVHAFRERLAGRKVTAMVRASRGNLISAACGQLAGKKR